MGTQGGYHGYPIDRITKPPGSHGTPGPHGTPWASWDLRLGSIGYKGHNMTSICDDFSCCSNLSFVRLMV